MRDLPRAVLLLAALAAVVVFALARPPAVPPPVMPAAADSAAFSAERARLPLRELTRSPRPVGSVAHAQTRAYLFDALRDLGLEPELQQATAVRRKADTVRAARATNILARLPGTDSSGAVVLVAHYDSVPNAPGAGDAGHGVAAILETVRALKAGPPLRNDLIVLFTDAEEVGLLGAQAYVDAHPWAADTGVVLNAEGRGHAGPVHMFRTTANNGELIRALGRHAPLDGIFIGDHIANDHVQIGECAAKKGKILFHARYCRLKAKLVFPIVWGKIVVEHIKVPFVECLFDDRAEYFLVLFA